MTIFENACKSVFYDMTLLEDEYVPRKLIGREFETEDLVEIYQTIFINGKPRNLILYGQPGTGKNATHAYVIDQLKKEIKKQKLDHEVKYFKVPCKQARTSTTVMRVLIQQAELSRCLPKKGISSHDHFMHFANLFSNDSHRLIIIEFNEIDSLKDDEILYMFSRKNETNAFHENTKIMIVGTSNDVNYNKSSHLHTLSSLDMLPIKFNAYREDELIGILNERRAAFKDGVVSDDVISMCSKLSAQEDGDARKAIKLLMNAGNEANKRLKNAEEENPKITIMDLISAHRMDDYSLEETIQDLPVQQKSLLLALVKLKIPLFRSGGLIKRDVVYPAYCDICRRYDISVLGERRALDLLTNLESNYVISIKKEGRGKNRRLIELDKRIIDNNNLLVYKSYLEKQLSWHQQHI